MHSSPYGPAGGGLTGTFPNPSVVPDAAGLALARAVFAPRSVATAAAAVNLSPSTLASVAGINGKTVARTALYVVPSGYDCVVLGLEVHCTAASSITVGPSCELGVTAGDIYASNATTLTTSGYTFTFPTSGVQKRATSGQTISMGVATGATGAAQTLAVDLIGYLFSRPLFPLQAESGANLQAEDGSILYVQ